jgi:hypothetical protein
MNPILRAEVIAVDLVHVVIICPICGLFHRHGSCGDITSTNYGALVPHCTEKIPQRFQGEYELVTTDYTIRKARLLTQDIEAWGDIQRSHRAAIVDQWREQEAAELDARILAAVRDIHAHGWKLSRWRITLWAGVTPRAVTMWMHQHGIYYGAGRSSNFMVAGRT